MHRFVPVEQPFPKCWLVVAQHRQKFHDQRTIHWRWLNRRSVFRSLDGRTNIWTRFLPGSEMDQAMGEVLSLLNVKLKLRKKCIARRIQKNGTKKLASQEAFVIPIEPREFQCPLDAWQDLSPTSSCSTYFPRAQPSCLPQIGHLSVSTSNSSA